jgi:hypothetical protein
MHLMCRLSTLHKVSMTVQRRPARTHKTKEKITRFHWIVKEFPLCTTRFRRCGNSSAVSVSQTYPPVASDLISGRDDLHAVAIYFFFASQHVKLVFQ